MSKPTTCATLLQFEHTILACHAMLTEHWDLPKGLAEAGEYGNEDYSHAAVREVKEETALILYPEWLRFIQLAHYNRDKDIALFHYRMLYKPDHASLYCSSTFTKDGKEFPEVDGYEWMSLDHFMRHTSKVMREYIERNKAIIEDYLTPVL